ncbi:unnamed protein product [Meloidogyne enterolobii]|uniref:Uncharacterized protein n=1 Tax=Meloidogyne enterolobii TaxID=390850 RepID=A0ACB0YNT8_MELEN
MFLGCGVKDVNLVIFVLEQCFNSNKHIETSKDFSRMVREILLGDVYGRLMISDRAENIDINVENFTIKSTKYQLSNKYNPEMKFSVYIEEIYVIKNQPISEIEIKRIN